MNSGRSLVVEEKERRTWEECARKKKEQQG
jgi:hypothetical protein